MYLAKILQFCNKSTIFIVIKFLIICYYCFMLKEELKILFSDDSECFFDNGIDKALLKSFDQCVLNLVSADNFAPEVLNVYRKFSKMKQEAPEAMKANLFVTIRNFAKEQLAENNLVETLVLYRFLIVKSKLVAEDYSFVGECLAKLESKDLALTFMSLYEKFELNKPLMFISMANFYNLNLKDYKAAIKYYEKYLQVDKTKSVIYTIVANLYSKVYGDSFLSEQVFYFEKANKLKPNDRLILHGLIFAYEKLGEKEKALKYFKILLKNNPTNIDYYNYGAFLISCGDFINGHKYFTYRFLIDDENLKYPVLLSNDNRWDLKSDISDKVLLVHYEQGFGDTFMYCRFIPLLKKFTKKILFVVQNNLVELIKSSPIVSDGIEVISDEVDLSSLKYDLSMALLDVPCALGIDSNSIPYCDGYLDIDKKIVEAYYNKYLSQTKNLKIGIACSGDKNANYHGRDIDICKFNILTDIKGVDFYSLQIGADIENSKIIDLGYTFDNFTQTAAAIKNMDLVISTDNVILNLAGALGVKTIGLFNKQTNFRWFKLTGENVGWYNSVRPLQAKIQDDWAGILSELVNITAGLINNSK